MYKQTYIKIIGILGILFLLSLAGCDRCTQVHSRPLPKSPITDAMIKRVETAGADYKFLADKLRALQQAGNNANIDEVDTTVNTLNNNGSGKPRKFTALHYAVLLDDLEIIKTLCDLGANPKVKDAQFGASLLHWAAQKDKTGAILSLAKQPGIDVNAKDKDGKTPLHWAAQNGSGTVLIALLQQPGIQVNEKDTAGDTPFKLAQDQLALQVPNSSAFFDYKTIVKKLKKHGGSI